MNLISKYFNYIPQIGSQPNNFHIGYFFGGEGCVLWLLTHSEAHSSEILLTEMNSFKTSGSHSALYSYLFWVDDNCYFYIFGFFWSLICVAATGKAHLPVKLLDLLPTVPQLGMGLYVYLCFCCWTFVWLDGLQDLKYVRYSVGACAQLSHFV